MTFFKHSFHVFLANIEHMFTIFITFTRKHGVLICAEYHVYWIVHSAPFACPDMLPRLDGRRLVARWCCAMVCSRTLSAHF